MERTSCPLREIKLAAEGGDAMTFAGYGAVFGNIDSYGDVISPGAFADTLRDARSSGTWPAMLAQHGGYLSAQDQMPIGIWTEMREDSTGLYVEGKLADTPRGREAYELLRMQPRPAIGGLSIGYIAKSWDTRTKPDEPRRTLKSVRLLEVSLVTFPANDRARVSSVKSQVTTIRDFEAFLRDAGGYSAAEAKCIASAGFKAAFPPRDEDDMAAFVQAHRARLQALRG